MYLFLLLSSYVHLWFGDPKSGQKERRPAGWHFLAKSFVNIQNTVKHKQKKQIKRIHWNVTNNIIKVKFSSISHSNEGYFIKNNSIQITNGIPLSSFYDSKSPLLNGHAIYLITQHDTQHTVNRDDERNRRLYEAIYQCTLIIPSTIK